MQEGVEERAVQHPGTCMARQASITLASMRAALVHGPRSRSYNLSDGSAHSCHSSRRCSTTAAPHKRHVSKPPAPPPACLFKDEPSEFLERQRLEGGVLGLLANMVLQVKARSRKQTGRLALCRRRRRCRRQPGQRLQHPAPRSATTPARWKRASARRTCRGRVRRGQSRRCAGTHSVDRNAPTAALTLVLSQVA